MLKLVELMINTLPMLDTQSQALARFFLEKQGKCGTYLGSGKTMGRVFSATSKCVFLTCTSCYNEKLLKLQKEVIASFKLIIKNPRILDLLSGFIPSKDNSLIQWVARNKTKLSYKLDDFKAVFCTLSPENVIAASTYQSFEEIKENINLLYASLVHHLGLFSLLDCRCTEQDNRINTHGHAIILFDKNFNYSNIGKDIRFNTNEAIRVQLSKIGYQEQSNTQWINTYYDLFRIIAYITKPREKEFEETIDPFSWLNVGLSVHYDHTQDNKPRRYRNYIFKDALKESRAENNKHITNKKLHNELATPMDKKKDDHIQIGNYKRSHYLNKLKKEVEYSYKRTSKIIIPDEKMSILEAVYLYEKSPHQFFDCAEKLDRRRLEVLSEKLNISTSKIKSLIITRKKCRWIKGKRGKFQKVWVN